MESGFWYGFKKRCIIGMKNSKIVTEIHDKSQTALIEAASFTPDRF